MFSYLKCCKHDCNDANIYKGFFKPVGDSILTALIKVTANICTYINACIHTYIHTYIQTYKHTCIHTYTHTSKRTLVSRDAKKYAHVFRPTRPLQCVMYRYMDDRSKLFKCCSSATITAIA